MVIKCIVRGCKSEWYPGCDIIFHSFPSNQGELNKWLNIVQLKKPFFEKAKICSLHFKPTDYMVTGKRLRPGVKPFFNEQANSSPLQLNEEYATSAACKRTWETMSAKPSTSHESLPLHDATEKNVIVSICKKPRSILRDFLEAGKENMPIDDTLTPKKVMDRSTSPVQISCADKSVQTRLKSSREETLMKRNKSLVQKIFRLNKTITNMKSLIKIVKSYTENSEIENIISGNFANICKEFKKKSKNPQGVRYSDEVKSFALTLHFYSAKAYEFIKQYATLPHV
ncbi:unnamed protein product [Colias eurytheme]|nr:unnamed protein product [Colias eurytheme]